MVKIIENRIKFDINAKHNARLFFKCYVIFFFQSDYSLGKIKYQKILK